MHEIAGWKPSSHTRTIAIIGEPIEHSLTPRLQNTALREVGADIVNVAFRVAPSNLRGAVLGARDLGIMGLMVTIPHKEAVLELCDELDASAQLIGASNFLEFRPDGRIVGRSSDGWAALRSLEEEGVAVKDKCVVILGGGGAARSLALTFARAGAKSIRLVNRSVERAQKIAAEAAGLQVPVSAMGATPPELSEALADAELLVNATSVGMTPNLAETPIPSEYMRAGLPVYDIVYNPLETRFLREARAAGARGVDGLGMLIYTNVYAVRTCARIDISATLMRAEAMRVFGERAG